MLGFIFLDDTDLSEGRLTSGDILLEEVLTLMQKTIN